MWIGQSLNSWRHQIFLCPDVNQLVRRQSLQPHWVCVRSEWEHFTAGPHWRREQNVCVVEPLALHFGAHINRFIAATLPSWALQLTARAAPHVKPENDLWTVISTPYQRFPAVSVTVSAEYAKDSLCLSEQGWRKPSLLQTQVQTPCRKIEGLLDTSCVDTHVSRNSGAAEYLPGFKSHHWLNKWFNHHKHTVHTIELIVPKS